MRKQPKKLFILNLRLEKKKMSFQTTHRWVPLKYQVVGGVGYWKEISMNYQSFGFLSVLLAEVDCAYASFRLSIKDFNYSLDCNHLLQQHFDENLSTACYFEIAEMLFFTFFIFSLSKLTAFYFEVAKLLVVRIVLEVHCTRQN